MSNWGQRPITVEALNVFCEIEKPPIVARPDVGRRRPTSMFTSVVFPAPFGLIINILTSGKMNMKGEVEKGGREEVSKAFMHGEGEVP